MKQFFDKLIKILGYSAATLIVLLAVLVGLFRLFLPRLPEYQEEIKAWASDAIGVQDPDFGAAAACDENSDGREHGMT